MSKLQPVQINISNPCNQSWDEMTPVDNGRFCNSCQKCVIDFTNYTDAQLFDFFNKHKSENICGKYRVNQLDRDIIIPQQRESRLFRMVASIGFALLLAQLPSINLYAQSPTHKTVNKDRKNTTNPNVFQISGRVLDEKKEPMIGAIVQVSINGVVKGGAATDEDGNYIIKPLEKGNYTVKIQSAGYYADTSHVTLGETNAVVSVQLKPDLKQLNKVVVLGGRSVGMGLIDMHASKGNITAEEIEKMPTRSTKTNPGKIIVDGITVCPARTVDHSFYNADNPGMGQTITSEQLEKMPIQ